MIYISCENVFHNQLEVNIFKLKLILILKRLPGEDILKRFKMCKSFRFELKIEKRKYDNIV